MSQPVPAAYVDLPIAASLWRALPEPATSARLDDRSAPEQVRHKFILFHTPYLGAFLIMSISLVIAIMGNGRTNDINRLAF